MGVMQIVLKSSEEQEAERRAKAEQRRLARIAAEEKAKGRVVKVPATFESAFSLVRQEMNIVEKVVTVRALVYDGEVSALRTMLRKYLSDKDFKRREKYFDALYVLLLQDVIEDLCATYLDNYYNSQSSYVADVPALGLTGSW